MAICYAAPLFLPLKQIGMQWQAAPMAAGVTGVKCSFFQHFLCDIPANPCLSVSTQDVDAKVRWERGGLLSPPQIMKEPGYQMVGF